MKRSHIRPTELLGAILAALLTLGVLGGCGADQPTQSNPATLPGSTTPGTVAPAMFPVTINFANTSITIQQKPERIISLSPSITEMLFAIKAGPQVKAVDKSSNYPTGTPVTDLSGFKPNIEAIAAHQPDLVVLARDRDDVADGLKTLNINVLILANPDSIDGIYDQIDVLGRATGNPTEATSLAASMRRDIEAIISSIPKDKPRVKAFYELSDNLETVTSKTFIGDLLSQAGIDNIADAAPDAAGGYPTLTNEYVITANPEVIFVAHTDGTKVDVAAIAARPGWNQMSAVTSKRIVVLENDVASRWGPRVVDLLRVVVEQSKPS